MEHSELFDLAIGIGPDGRAVTEDERDAARRQLIGEGCLQADLQIFQAQREAEVIRDDTARVRGCSFSDCHRPAVWERVFEQSLSASIIITQTLAVATMARGSVIKGILQMGHFRADFEQQRLGQSIRNGLKMAHQYGCWLHSDGFTAIPSNSGRHCYVIVKAIIPKARPHAVFRISDEKWSALQIAAEAQSIGLTDNPLSFCSNCRLPHEPITGKGLKPGEGDDFWRSFCAYCKAEIKPSDDV